MDIKVVENSILISLKVRLKVLPLERWMLLDEEEILAMGYTEARSVYNRNAQFYDRNWDFWWFEVNGKAYTGKDGREMFLYRLNAFNYTLLRDCEVETLKKARFIKPLSKMAEKLLYEHETKLSVIDNPLSTRLDIFKLFK